MRSYGLIILSVFIIVAFTYFGAYCLPFNGGMTFGGDMTEFSIHLWSFTLGGGGWVFGIVGWLIVLIDAWIIVRSVSVLGIGGTGAD